MFLRPPLPRPRCRRVALSVLLACIALVSPAVAERDWNAVQIKTTEVAHGVYMLQGAGGNIGLAVGTNAVLLVDGQYEQVAPKLQQAIAGLTDNPVRFLVNTHYHDDHVGGNATFGKQGATIVAHDNVRRRMVTEQWSALFEDITPPYPAVALPAITFDDSLTFHLGSLTVTCFHIARAHTDGDVVVWFREANVMHLGDLFFNGRFPVLDAPAGGDIDGLIAGVDRMLAVCGPATRLIPGHGPLATKADLEAYRNMLAAARDRVAPLVKQKQTLEQIQAAKPLADFDALWGGGFVKQDMFLKEIVWSLDRSRIPARP
jgi:cyclase